MSKSTFFATEADSALVPSSPETVEARLQPALSTRIRERFHGIQFNLLATELDGWITGIPTAKSGVLSSIALELQRLCDAGSNKQAIELLHHHAVAHATTRAALAQRTFIFLATIGLLIDDLNANAELNGIRLASPTECLLHKARQITPDITVIKTEPEYRTLAQLQNSAHILEAECNALETFAAILHCFRDQTNFKPDAEGIPPEEIRSWQDCLGAHTTWMLNLLRHNLQDIQHTWIGVWSSGDWQKAYQDQLINILTVEDELATLPEEAAALLSSLCLTSLYDPVGMEACATIHAESVKVALDNPDSTAVAVLCESQALHLLDAVIMQVMDPVSRREGNGIHKISDSDSFQTKCQKVSTLFHQVLPHIFKK